MDSDARIERRDDDRQIERLDAADEGIAQGPAAASVISANLAGINTGISTAATGAPSAGNIGGFSGAAAEAVLRGDAEDEEAVAMNLDALEEFGSKHRQTGDEGVSTEQSELEADELNG